MDTRAQSTMEMAILVLVIIAALFAMQIYMKRSIQGRLRQAAGSIGEQYDPQATNSDYVVSHRSNTVTTTTTSPTILTVCEYGYCSDRDVIVTESRSETLYDITEKSGNEQVSGF